MSAACKGPYLLNWQKAFSSIKSLYEGTILPTAASSSKATWLVCCDSAMIDQGKWVFLRSRIT